MTMKYMDIEEFMNLGYLHEVNRQFLHPLGMALVVGCDTAEDTGEQVGPWRITGIWDARDDPEGFIFVDETLEPDKARRVQEEWDERANERQLRLGFVVQPIPADDPEG